MIRIAQNSEELFWSDEDESDEKYLVKQLDGDDGDDSESLDSFQINENRDHLESSIIGSDRLIDHRRSRFTGYITVDKTKRGNAAIALKQPQQLQMLEYPHVPSNVREILGDKLLHGSWQYFLNHGADDSEMILVSDAVLMSDEFGFGDVSSLDIIRGMDSNDFVEYSPLMTEISKNYNKHECMKSSKQITNICNVCCAMKACVHCLPNHQTVAFSSDPRPPAASIDPDESDELPPFHFVGAEEHRLNIIYSQIKHDLNGTVRIRHISEIMEKLSIPFEKKRLPQTFWKNRGELLIKNVHELIDLIEKLRTDLDEKVDPLAGMFKYELPRWLREEFKASEIMLYEHHFSLIDQDGGGSIDVDELQQLVIAFGSKISRDDAQALLDEYDMDGGGTIDFIEFMVLIYKIQRGTIDLTSSDFAQALVEAKSQLKIFEEIEEVSRDPPALCSVAHFGGTPVECNFRIEGPPGTPYEGFQLTLQMTFRDGYPFIQPDIMLRGRVMGLHVLPALGGDARLMHVKQLWSAEWSMRRLLVHVVDILTVPDPQLLPDNLYEVFIGWQNTLHLLRIKLKTVAENQLKAEAESRAHAQAKAQEKEDQERDDGIIDEKDEKDGKQSESRECKDSKHTPLSSARRPERAAGTPTTADAKLTHLNPNLDEKDKNYNNEKSSSEDNGEVKRADSKCDSDNDSDEIDEIDETAVLARAEQLERLLTIDDLSDELVRMKVMALSRIERMHLGTMQLFLLDPQKYFESVQTFMRSFFKPDQ